MSSNQGIEPIVIASMGRSGSTLVYDAVVEAVIARSPLRNLFWGHRLTADQCWNLSNKPLIRGTVYKTHDYPERLVVNGGKAIFLFGSTLDAAKSVHSAKERFGQEWVEEHFVNLRSEGKYEDLFKSDVLNFEKQIHSWAVTETIPTLCLRFETLWENSERLSDFLNMKVVLPKERARKVDDYDSEVTSALKHIFDPIDERLRSLPDCFISSHENEAYFK
ncbi:hypothetical protein [Celeribacter baekdonensis]|uniref:Sulfotransferase domain-containing protein n=1 Tax=Celeribacter baekdonensis B30 TaxID=1208323 RepID=K2JGP0_9RHOB|nr:hypothetical protein [Celeribacter baekdonensis]EKE74338.1 hypothetical protein B30_01390 [Celeribacter baekdonensis B30]